MHDVQPDQPEDQRDRSHLIRLAQGSGPDAERARERLLTQFAPLIRSAVGRVTIQELRDDARQAACVGFLEALHRADPNRPESFPSFARAFVNGEVLDLLKDEAEHQKRILHYSEAARLEEEDDDAALDRLMGGYEEPSFGRAEQWDRGAAVRRFVRELPPAHRRLAWDIFWRGRSQAEAARARGVSRAAVTMALNGIYSRARVELPSGAAA